MDFIKKFVLFSEIGTLLQLIRLSNLHLKIFVVVISPTVCSHVGGQYETQFRFTNFSVYRLKKIHYLTCLTLDPAVVALRICP